MQVAPSGMPVQQALNYKYASGAYWLAFFAGNFCWLFVFKFFAHRLAALPQAACGALQGLPRCLPCGWQTDLPTCTRLFDQGMHGFEGRVLGRAQPLEQHHFGG